MTDLRRLAEAATPGPDWYTAPFLDAFIDFDEGQVFPPADAAYIAACPPEVILALLDVVDAAREAASTPVGGYYNAAAFSDRFERVIAALDRLDEVTK